MLWRSRHNGNNHENHHVGLAHPLIAMRVAITAEITIATNNVTSLKRWPKNCLMPKQTLLHSISSPTLNRRSDVLFLCAHFQRSPGHHVDGGSLAEILVVRSASVRVRGLSDGEWRAERVF